MTDMKGIDSGFGYVVKEKVDAKTGKSKITIYISTADLTLEQAQLLSDTLIDDFAEVTESIDPIANADDHTYSASLTFHNRYDSKSLNWFAVRIKGFINKTGVEAMMCVTNIHPQLSRA